MSRLIEVRDITKSYRQRRGGNIVTALGGVSFGVERGEVLGLLGPNGAGKTTTIKTICGLITPDSGTVMINGFDVQRERLRALRAISAVLEGNRNLYWRLTVRENLEYFAGNRGASRRQVRARIDELLRQFRLFERGNALVNHLSRGMQQKLAIAVAMLAGSEIILLDEPTLGLDVEAGYEVRQLLRDIAHTEGRTLIISSHDMPVVQDLCQRVIIISGGRVVADDQVSNLLKLFATRAYRVSLGAPLSDAQLQRLQARFSASLENPAGTVVRVNLEHSEDIYELIEILRLNRTPVEAIDRTTINFEQVFLQVINGAKPPEEIHAL